MRDFYRDLTLEDVLRASYDDVAPLRTAWEIAHCRYLAGLDDAEPRWPVSREVRARIVAELRSRGLVGEREYYVSPSRQTLMSALPLTDAGRAAAEEIRSRRSRAADVLRRFEARGYTHLDTHHGNCLPTTIPDWGPPLRSRTAVTAVREWLRTRHAERGPGAIERSGVRGAA